MQYGGFPGQQPGFASFIIRAYATRARHFGLNDACLFIDLRAAFHHLVRQLSLVMPDPEFTETLRTTLAKDGYNPDILQEQCYNSERFGPLPLPAHLGKIVEDLHTFTWYSIRGSQQPSRTFRGTRPGSPYADLGFNSFIGQIMLELQEYLLQDWELEEAMTQAGLPPAIVGWVDDIAIPICACSPRQLLGMIQRTGEKVIDLMWRAGLTVNLDKGKTECIANLRGTGDPQARHDLFVQQEGRIRIEVPEGFGAQSPTLQVVGQYSRLGTCIGQELCTRGEVDRRIGQAQIVCYRNQSSKIGGSLSGHACSCSNPWSAPNYSTMLASGDNSLRA